MNIFYARILFFIHIYISFKLFFTRYAPMHAARKQTFQTVWAMAGRPRGITLNSLREMKQYCNNDNNWQIQQFFVII